MYHPFSVVETIKTSWGIFKGNFATIIVYSGVTFLLLSILSVIVALTISPDTFGATMLISLLLICLQAYSTLGLYKLIFTVIDSEYYEFEFSKTIPTFKMMLSYLGVVFILAFVITNFNIGVNMLEDYPDLQDVIVGAGMIVGFYISLRIMFFNTFVVDDHSGPIESLKQSFELTRGYIFKIISILLIIILFIAIPVYISRFYPFVSIAILFTYPFVNIILAVTYRKLVYSHLDVDDDIAETN